MMMRTLRLLTVLAAMVHGSSAFALFDVQVMAGKRWYELSGDYDKNISSQEINVAAHIDPIPLVPVAFGASAALGTLNKDDYGPNTKEAKTFEGALEVMAWLPMVPVVTPYARLKYPVIGTATVETETAGVKTSAISKLSGPHLNLGVKWSPLPVVKLLAEVGRGMQKLELDELKVGGDKQSTSMSGDAASNTFLVGIEIGL